MLGVIYIALSVALGNALCSLFLPRLGKRAKQTGVPEYMVKIPAWYLTGTLLLTWLVYLSSYLFQSSENPMLYGNLVAWGLALLMIALKFFYEKKHGTEQKGTRAEFFTCVTQNNEKLTTWQPLVFTVLAALFTTFLMFLTFYAKDGSVYVGYSVFSDFAPHLGMIRSFSASNNFPTQYAHFAGEDIRYHFMFQFLAGNLEFLGMRLDFAFNLPSIFGMLFVYMLLFTLTVRITRSYLCGWLTALLFTFRISFTVFRFMAEQRKGTVWQALLDNTEFLGYTQNENWGLWNLNVYCNQRHLAFALAMQILAVYLFYPYVEAMGKKLWAVRAEKKIETVISGVPELFKTMFFSKTAFGIKDLRFAVGMGLFLGGIAFWNGSALVATLAMLFFMAAVSDYRLDYLITALIALGLSLLQSSFFIEGAAVSPTFFFGFLAENKTLWGVILFVVELTGIVLAVALAGAMLLRGVKRYMLFVFFVPFFLAFTLSLTVDVTVNHKWIMMSLMLVSIFAAYVLTRLFESGDWLKRMLAGVLVVVLTATGVYDLSIVIKRNENYLIFHEEDPVTNWVMENADCDDIFLTPYYSLNNVVMGGAMLYYGWPYYAWSAGYDTNQRSWDVKQMYEASTVEELDYLIKEFGIRYIIVDHDCRTSSEYDVREDVIEAAYEAVFEHDTNDWMVRIFDTEKKR